jgi:hypothetical protein
MLLFSRLCSLPHFWINFYKLIPWSRNHKLVLDWLLLLLILNFYILEKDRLHLILFRCAINWYLVKRLSLLYKSIWKKTRCNLNLLERYLIIVRLLLLGHTDYLTTSLLKIIMIDCVWCDTASLAESWLWKSAFWWLNKCFIFLCFKGWIHDTWSYPWIFMSFCLPVLLLFFLEFTKRLAHRHRSVLLVFYLRTLNILSRLKKVRVSIIEVVFLYVHFI